MNCRLFADIAAILKAPFSFSTTPCTKRSARCSMVFAWCRCFIWPGAGVLVPAASRTGPTCRTSGSGGRDVSHQAAPALLGDSRGRGGAGHRRAVSVAARQAFERADGRRRDDLLAQLRHELDSRGAEVVRQVELAAGSAGVERIAAGSAGYDGAQQEGGSSGLRFPGCSCSPI